MQNTEIPDFPHLVNFPAHLHRYRTLSDVEKDRRRCVMCGETRLCSSYGSNASREAFSRSKQKMAQYNRNPSSSEEPGGGTVHIIPKQNKGLCTACDVAVWKIKDSRIEIKWCKGCKNFRPWAAFGDKGLATKCFRCRERQREKYANQKEAKFKRSAKKDDTDGEKRIEKSPKGRKSKASLDSEPLNTSQNHGMSCLIAATTKVSNEQVEV